MHTANMIASLWCQQTSAH